MSVPQRPSLNLDVIIIIIIIIIIIYSVMYEIGTKISSIVCGFHTKLARWDNLIFSKARDFKDCKSLQSMILQKLTFRQIRYVDKQTKLENSREAMIN